MARKTFIAVKRGLLDPRHRERLANRIWLYLHLLDIVQWDTGIITGWRDEDQAIAIEMELPTLRRQRQELEKLGYIECIRRRYTLDIRIYNYINPRVYSGVILNPRPAHFVEDDGDSALVEGSEPEIDLAIYGGHSDITDTPSDVLRVINSDQSENSRLINSDQCAPSQTDQLCSTFINRSKLFHIQTVGEKEKIGPTSKTLWDYVVEGANMWLGDRRELFNPLFVSQDKKCLLFSAYQTSPEFEAELNRLAVEHSGKKMRVKVSVVHAPVSFDKLDDYTRGKIEIKRTLTELLGYNPYIDAEDEKAINHMASTGVDASTLRAAYVRLTKQTWRTAPIRPATIAREVAALSGNGNGSSDKAVTGVKVTYTPDDIALAERINNAR